MTDAPSNQSAKAGPFLRLVGRRGCVQCDGKGYIPVLLGGINRRRSCELCERARRLFNLSDAPSNSGVIRTSPTDEKETPQA